MGAKSQSAFSTSLLVLLVIMVMGPVASATDPNSQQVREVRDQVMRAPEDAQKAAQEGQEEAEEAASDALGEGGKTAETAQTEARKTGSYAESIAVFVVDFSIRIANNVHDWAKKTGDDVITVVGPIAQRFTGGGPQTQDGGFSAQSTEYAVVRADVYTPLLWVAASAGAGLLVLYVARRILGLGVVPLLSRIAHSDIYNNDARRTISELVNHEPGQCLNELVTRTGYSRNAVSYHLFVLEKEEEIVSVKDGKYRRYFARNGKYVNGAKNVVAALRNETTLKLARAVQARPGSIQRDLCVELGSTPSATCWHAKRLLDLGVIRKQRVANTVQYFPGEAMAKYDLSDMGLTREAPAPQPTSAVA